MERDSIIKNKSNMSFCRYILGWVNKSFRRKWTGNTERNKKWTGNTERNKEMNGHRGAQQEMARQYGAPLKK